MMKPSFYTGRSGLLAFQEQINVTGNNIANSNTTAYKPQVTGFRDLLYSEMDANTPNDPLYGNGVKAINKGINAAQSGLTPSNNSLDLAIMGDGWFEVQSGDRLLYTRDGSFSISLSGNRAYLVNQRGDFVMDSNGRKITTEISSKTNSIDPHALVKRVGVYTFDYDEALTPESSNCYSSNALSGTAVSDINGNDRIKTGYLEMSGVSLADEMVDIITAQRSYQLSARVVQVADELEQTVNSLRN